MYLPFPFTFASFIISSCCRRKLDNAAIKDWVHISPRAGCCWGAPAQTVTLRLPRWCYQTKQSLTCNFQSSPTDAICTLGFMLAALWSRRARHVGADTDVLFVTEDDEDAVCARGCGSFGTSKSERAFSISVSWHKINDIEGTEKNALKCFLLLTHGRCDTCQLANWLIHCGVKKQLSLAAPRGNSHRRGKWGEQRAASGWWSSQEDRCVLWPEMSD